MVVLGRCTSPVQHIPLMNNVPKPVLLAWLVDPVDAWAAGAAAVACCQPVHLQKHLSARQAVHVDLLLLLLLLLQLLLCWHELLPWHPASMQ